MGSPASSNEALIAFVTKLAEMGRKDAYACRIADQHSKVGYFQTLGFPSDTVIKDHLSSACPVGIYLMEGRTTRVAVLDLDDHDGTAGFECIKDVAIRICDPLRANGLRPLVFVSGGGHGIHIWMVWKDPQIAKDVRKLLQDILGALELRNGTKGVAHGTVEIFPKQDEVELGRVGNLIALPFSRSSVALSGDLTPIPTEKFISPREDQLYSMPLARVQHPSHAPEAAHRRPTNEAEIRAALSAIPADEHDDWIRIGIILRCEFGDTGLPIWNEWSMGSPEKYPGEEILATRWTKLPSTASIGLGSLFYMAQQRGWEPSGESYAPYVMSARELGKLDIPRRLYIVDPFLPERGLAMIWAERGIGKTWIALCLALAIARGEDFLAYEVLNARSVFYVDGEMSLAELKERLLLLCPTLPENLFILSSETLALDEQHLNISNAKHRDRIEKTLAYFSEVGHPKQVIILDNLSSLTSGVDENSNSEQDELLQWLIRLRHMGYTVVIVHHAGKSGQQRGASRREDILDTSIKLEIPKDEEGIDRSGGATFILSFTKTRGRAPVPDKLVLFLRENVSGQLEFIFEKSVVIPRYLKTLKAIAEGVFQPSGVPRPYRTQAELVEFCKVTKGTISKHVTKLKDLELIMDTPNGLVVTPQGIAEVSKLFGCEVPPSLRGDPHAENEIPF